MADPHFFGIRHHGPGCARSLVRAFDVLQPDCVLIEGPPEGDGLLSAVLTEGMQPPVALLGYCPDDPQLAVYFPFAEFSPEWQAIRWALRQGVPVRFIDLPLVHGLALLKARQTAHIAALQDESAAGQEAIADAELEVTNVKSDDETLVEETAADDYTGDPLDWLARAAGYADGESWWNHQVEERGDSKDVFAAIEEAMTALRTELGEHHRDAEDSHRESLREAQMRQCVREAQKEGHERIAVVCGAWHLAGLQATVTAIADQALLKGLPKVKVQATWVPWTYRHLTRHSGYGAGIVSPGWYEHLWQSQTPSQRTVGWLARVARLMRQRDLDCSSAHLIEATRLADTLAALRGRPAAGLEELQEAARTVLTLGDETVLRFIADELVVGNRFGSVPSDVPMVPLQRDVEQAQKTLRLKPEALQRTLDLDLRNANDLARSHLLHRLRLLDIPWGQLARVGRTRGTFHEVWSLQWEPEFQLRLIEASQWGQTVFQAATARVCDRARNATDLAELSTMVDQVLLAELDAAVPSVTAALQNRAALTGDVLQLLAALPPLSNVFRYGNVRQTDATMVAHVLDGLIVRAAIGLPLACQSLADSAAQTLREQLLAGHAAVALRQSAPETEEWCIALRLIADSMDTHPLLQGLAVRLLLDDAVRGIEQVAQAMSFQLSAGADPLHAAAWLEGFLNRNALVLLHDQRVWQLIDDWLDGLAEEHFVAILPLVRRSFSAFSASERSELAQRASQGVAKVTPVLVAAWNEERALLPLPLLRQLLGV